MEDLEALSCKLNVSLLWSVQDLLFSEGKLISGKYAAESIRSDSRRPLQAADKEHQKLKPPATSFD